MARSRQAVVLDNLALRQQLAVAVRGGHRPRLVTVDRTFCFALRAVLRVELALDLGRDGGRW